MVRRRLRGVSMGKQNRRAFMQLSAGALAAGLNPVWATRAAAGSHHASLGQHASGKAPAVSANEGRKALRLGLIISVGGDPDAALVKIRNLGIATVQLFMEELEPSAAGPLCLALEKYGIEPTAVVVGGPGREVWDFYQGPLTIGLVPRDTRTARIAHIKKASDFAKRCGIAAVQTHCGFIPENPNDPLYSETVDAIREVAAYCRRNGQNFRYETGQETPITLVRAIHDVGTDNQGVNFDLANLILYGKANPVDAIEVIGPYVQGIHAKDGRWPTNPRDLGQEVPISKGKVDFPRIIAGLKELDYRGAVTIEREISGPQQMEDVRVAKAYLEKLIGT